MRLLLVEDDRIVRITVRDALAEHGYTVTECADGSAALAALGRDAFDILLTDVRLPGVDGLTLFRTARRENPRAAVVLMTAFADAGDAVAVMREGARDYLQKPFEIDELLVRIGRVREELEFRARMEAGRGPAQPERLQGETPRIVAVRERIEAAAGSDAPVLLTGETGTGKDLCARTIHERSRRATRPFVAVTCASSPETLFDAEQSLERAEGGTLLLDELGELSLASQARLLRTLERSAPGAPGAGPPALDVRVVAATTRDLAAEVARGAFRRDLYYRLNVIDVRLPPLRERRADVPILARAFLEEISARVGLPVPELSPEAAGALAIYDFPGNVRELLQALERAVALGRGGPLLLEHLPADVSAGAARARAHLAPGEEALRPLSEAVEAFERTYIQRALEQTGGHRTRAAALLGISRKSLWERLRDATRGEPPEE